MSKEFKPVKGWKTQYGGEVMARCICGDYTYYKENQKKRLQDWKARHEKECTVEKLIEDYNQRIAKHEKEMAEEKETLEMLYLHRDHGVGIEVTHTGTVVQTGNAPIRLCLTCKRRYNSRSEDKKCSACVNFGNWEPQEEIKP